MGGLFSSNSTSAVSTVVNDISSKVSTSCTATAEASQNITCTEVINDCPFFTSNCENNASQIAECDSQTLATLATDAISQAYGSSVQPGGLFSPLVGVNSTSSKSDIESHLASLIETKCATGDAINQTLSGKITCISSTNANVQFMNNLSQKALCQLAVVTNEVAHAQGVAQAASTKSNTATIVLIVFICLIVIIAIIVGGVLGKKYMDKKKAEGNGGMPPAPTSAPASTPTSAPTPTSTLPPASASASASAGGRNPFAAFFNGNKSSAPTYRVVGSYTQPAPGNYNGYAPQHQQSWAPPQQPYTRGGPTIINNNNGGRRTGRYHL